MHQTIDEMSLIKSLSVLIHQCSQPFNDHSWYASYAEVVFCSSCSMFRADYKYFHERTKLQNFHLSRWRAYSSITFSWQANLWNLFQTPCMHETSPTLSRVSFKTNKQTSKRTNKQTNSINKKSQGKTHKNEGASARLKEELSPSGVLNTGSWHCRVANAMHPHAVQKRFILPP